MDYALERAYAKINLYLDAYAPDPRTHRHPLLTIMQCVDLYDDIYIRKNDNGKINLLCSVDMGIEDKDNIAYRAAEEYLKWTEYKSGLDIVILKHIPIAAGLGGGSADAAAVVRALDKFLEKPAPAFRRNELLEKLGADVPFCYQGGAYICSPDQKPLLQITGIHNYQLVIAIGDKKLSTADQYKKLDDLYGDFSEYTVGEGYGETVGAYSAGHCRKAFEYSKNIFESLYGIDAKIWHIKDIMSDHNAYFSQLSGSGPAIYGVFPDGIYAEEAKEELEQAGYEAYVCSPVNVSYETIEEGSDIW